MNTKKNKYEYDSNPVQNILNIVEDEHNKGFKKGYDKAVDEFADYVIDFMESGEAYKFLKDEVNDLKLTLERKTEARDSAKRNFVKSVNELYKLFNEKKILRDEYIKKTQEKLKDKKIKK